MCVQDIQISRRAKIVRKTITPDANLRATVSRNENRIAWFFCDPTNTSQYTIQVMYGTQFINILTSYQYSDGAVGGTLFTTNFHLNTQNAPGIVSDQFYVLCPSSSSIVTVEIWIDESTEREARESIG